jgi:hypothetical protein
VALGPSIGRASIFHYERDRHHAARISQLRKSPRTLRHTESPCFQRFPAQRAATAVFSVVNTVLLEPIR